MNNFNIRIKVKGHALKKEVFMGFLKHTGQSTDFDSIEYKKILCPEYPSFLDEYIALPVLQRLAGVGLLCGTDWTPLFKNRFFYSRLDHSINCALIVWNFTKDKTQTIAALFHDVSTPAFSHVTDFRNGDALKQESTERGTVKMINEDLELSELLFKDGIYKYEMQDYHIYPIADNKMPGLSADRLEYMFPSGCSLDSVWTMQEIKNLYSNITVLKNEEGKPELGFNDKDAALEYAAKFIQTSLILQHNEDKIAMQLMADVITRAIECSFISEEELFSQSERSIIQYFDSLLKENGDETFCKLYHTFRNMTVVQHTREPLAESYCVSLSVKKRYVDPLVKSEEKCTRLSKAHPSAQSLINDFLNFTDTPYGCVPWC